MQTRTLGQNLEVSALALGCMSSGYGPGSRQGRDDRVDSYRL
jgi:aryl-alcohol dehydrogenase-like predicted oxidoreductase